MNYLAHFYLAFDNPEWLLGQFMGDYVKGKKYLEYSQPIQQDILNLFNKGFFFIGL